MVNHYQASLTQGTLCGEYGPDEAPWYSSSSSLVSCNGCLDLFVADPPARIPHPSSPVTGLLDVVNELVDMMEGRHRKYGPGNIAEFGPLGILVRLSDKFARLRAGQENFDDETVENTLDDVIGYALIWKLWLRKQWPGSEG